MNLARLIRYHITLIQLESYDLKRYYNMLFKRYTVKSDMRQKAVWTAKLKGIIALAAILIATCIALTAYSLGILFAGALLLISAFLFPLYITLAVLITAPLDVFLKRRIINAARRKLAQFPSIKIIGITGSYGKTTMKEVITTIVQERFTVLSTPESINTPLGIARLILTKLTKEIEVFVVEMGAHQKGDIRELCALTPPDISVITGINEAHIERFGSLENTVHAKFEIVRHAKPNAVVILNTSDKRVRTHYEKHCAGHTVIFYGDSTQSGARYTITNTYIEPDGLTQLFSFTNEYGEAYRLTTQLLGGYAPATIMGATCVAESLGMTRAEITHGVVMIQPITHRLQPFHTANGILIIDDSYNGNPDGAREAIHILARFKNKRKIYVTPGLVEMGSENAKVHRAIGTELATVADIVVLIKNSATQYIAEALKNAGFKKADILQYATAHEAHEALPAILKSGDIVLFQNDWPDNYL